MEKSKEQELKQKCIELRSKGYSYRQIFRELEGKVSLKKIWDLVNEERKAARSLVELESIEKLTEPETGKEKSINEIKDLRDIEGVERIKEIEEIKEIEDIVKKEILVKEEEVITKRGISLLEGLIFAISELLEMNKKLRQGNAKSIETIHKIAKTIKSARVLTSVEKAQIKKQLEYALRQLADENMTYRLRINLFDTLQKYLTLVSREEVMLKHIEEVSILLNDFFETMNVLDDNNYRRYKEELLNRQPNLKEKFDKYEQSQNSCEVTNA